MLKVGLIGCGGMGMTHIDCYTALKDSVEVAYVADLFYQKAKKAADKTGAKICNDADELLLHTDELDIVDICLPTYLHTEFAVKAMEKGCDVFIEKPVCLNSEQAKELLKIQKRTGAKVQIGQVIRFWPEYMWLKKVVTEKTYGKVISGVFERLSVNPKWGWENWYNDPYKSGTAALDLHIHDVDYIRYIMGGNPKEVVSSAARNKDGVIQQIFTKYLYKDAIINAEGGWDFPDNFPFSMRFRVKLERATVVYDENGLTVYSENGEKFKPEFNDEFEGENSAGINVSALGGYYNELKYFTNCVIQGIEPEIAPLSEAVKSLELVLKEIDIAGGEKI